MHPDEALRQIAEIRERMAGSQVFPGFRSAAVAVSGALALATALAQPWLVPAPAEDLASWLWLWIGVAVLCVLLGAAGLVSWARTTDCELAGERIRVATEQVLPAMVVGALVTLAIVRFEPGVAWMLPGLWSLVFSLAVFALRRLLTAEVLWVGAYYVVAGAVCLFVGQRAAAFAPWQMAVCFGGGQLFAAAVLHLTVERERVAS